MSKKPRERLAGELLGIARTGSSDKIPEVARDLLTTGGWSDRYSEKDLGERLLPSLVEKLATRLDIAYSRTFGPDPPYVGEPLALQLRTGGVFTQGCR